MPDETLPSAAKPSAVEVAKAASDYLLGDIPRELVDGAPGFGKAAIQVHDDRDAIHTSPDDLPVIDIRNL